MPLIFVILTISMSLPAQGALEEDVLLKEAHLAAKEAHVRNMKTFGMDPKTCRPTQDAAELLSQMNKLVSENLGHCSDIKTSEEEAIEVSEEFVIEDKNAVVLAEPETKVEAEPESIIQTYDPEQYEPTEDDGLFSLISKAYKRNINRILSSPENK